MKLFHKPLLALAALFLATSAFAQTPATREHRAIWLSPYLTSSWPSSKFTDETSVNTQRSILQNRLQKFKDQNVNIIYFHVRAYCDALYKSSYEPTSAQIAAYRGGEIVADPLQMIIDEAHKVGIEVYAWLNPYRYSQNTSYGSNPLEYENAHPDWLIKNSKQTILNPGLEEVKQRIVDIVSEIATNYDVDGIIFDDYFYPQGGTSESASSAPDYQTYLDSHTSLSIGDWRRQNVNEMVARVYTAIKNIKPWLPFGISPAGIASPAKVTTEYGLPSISGDWQYNQIYSDPLAWLKQGTIDFISPQVYWPSRFDEVSDWWANAVRKYKRHFYPSVDITDIVTGQTEEYMREALFTREVNGRDNSGFVIFHYANYVNFAEKIYDKRYNFGINFAKGVYTEKALTPIRPWNNDYHFRMTSNVRRNGNTLLWDAVDGCRYTVYAVPAGTEQTFASQREFLDGISYTNSYDIPADKTSGYTFAVAVYDRYGNEYAPLFEGHSANPLPAPVNTFPADGSQPGFMFDFKWQSQGTRHTVELADNPQFDNILASLDVEGCSLPNSAFPKLTTGNTYYWRVSLCSPDATHAVSDPTSFIASEITFTSPADTSTDNPYNNLDIAWTAAAPGTAYTITVATRQDMTGVVYTNTLTDVNHVTIPARVLNSGRTYYMTVSAVNGKASSQSAVNSFTTVNKTDYTTPAFVNPASEGQTIHSNQCISVQPYDGLRSLEIMICADTKFATRSSKKYSFNDFSTSTPELSEVKISSKALVDGKTYYVRTRGTYNTTSGTDGYTPYVISSFVYSSSAGVDDIAADAPADLYIDADDTLHVPAGTNIVDVYTLTGALVASFPAEGAETLSLSHLPAGQYLITTRATTPRTIKWLH